MSVQHRLVIGPFSSSGSGLSLCFSSGPAGSGATLLMGENYFYNIRDENSNWISINGISKVKGKLF